MHIVAIAMARDEERIIGEGVSEALEWVDRFVICDHGSIDDTAEIARAAGAIVETVDRDLPFNEGLRQRTVEIARESGPCDWLVRIDVDEIYHSMPAPRLLIEQAEATGHGCVKALQAEFWLTFDDVERGLLVEPDDVSIQKLRRWYTIGHPATVAWRDHPDLYYSPAVVMQKRRNVPITADGRDVSSFWDVYHDRLLQKHYNCQTLGQVMARIPDRSNDLNTFGKYKYNLIVDQSMGLYWLGPDEEFNYEPNHSVVYDWYEKSQAMLCARSDMFGW